MVNADMQTTVYGKWILAGEHAVLRGSPALVFPIGAKSLRVQYTSGPLPLVAEFGGELGAELQLLFWGVIERAVSMLGRTREQLTGKIEVTSQIPVGAGLGASAALCVAVGRWLAWKGWVSESELYEFSRQLENLFHGESSGVDIAVALSGQGLHFERSGVRNSVSLRWQPHWYLSYSGKRGVTSECVAKVKALWDRNLDLAKTIDQDMRRAVTTAEDALTKSDEASGFSQLVEAICLARTCFDRWQLTGGETGLHLERLEKAGAAAVKPTGSGDGGYVLSLWQTPPPSDIAKILIPIHTERVCTVST